MRPFSLLALMALVAVAGPSARADESARWIAKARSFLGTESALGAVRSLHFEGTFVGMELRPDPADAKKTVEQPITVKIDIIFQRPMQQRQILRSDKFERTTALDNYDGWERVVETAGKGTSRLALLDAPGIKRLRATTIENLSFYSERDGPARRVQFLGEAVVDGIACAKLSFTHSDSIVFRRFFDQATGRLVKTEIEGGGEIREEGEMIVSGVRFPRKVINKAADGRMTTINFDRVTVNEAFPPETFAVPALPAR